MYISSSADVLKGLSSLVEQNHADHWVEWAVASGISRDDLSSLRICISGGAALPHELRRDLKAAGQH